MVGSLRKNAISGMVWTGFERTGTILVQFVIGLVLANILNPSDYGVIAMLAIFMAISDTLIESGFGNALIQKKNVSSVDYSTALIFNFGVGIFLYLLLYAGAPFIAVFYNTPVLTEVARAYGWLFVINSLSIAQTAKLSIELRFKSQSLISILSAVVSGGVGIAFACAGYGVWALVIQALLGAALRLVILSLVSRMNFHWEFSCESFKGLWKFGSKLLCSSMINTIYNNLYTLIIGHVYNPTQVGNYSRADQFGNLPSNTLTSIVLRVIYPILSKIQDENERLESTYRAFIKLTIFILSPLMVGLCVLAKQVVVLTIGYKWMGCVLFLQILCLGYLLNPLTHLNLNLLYVKGRTDLVLKLEVIKKPIGFILLIASIPFGIMAMCCGRAFYCFLAFAMNCYYTNKIIGLGFLKQSKDIAPIFFRAFLMGLIVWLCTTAFDSLSLQLFIGILVGIVSYLLLAIVMRDDSLVLMLNMTRQKRNDSF